jgi:hypothetical protein
VFVLVAWFAPTENGRWKTLICLMPEASADRSSFCFANLNEASDPHTCPGAFAATEPAASSCGEPLSDPAPGPAAGAGVGCGAA